MNFAELSRGTRSLLVAGLLLLIDSFLAWQQVSVGAGNFHVTASASMWHGVGVVAGLLVVALLIWEGLQLAGVLRQVELPVSAVMITVAGLRPPPRYSPSSSSWWPTRRATGRRGSG